MDGLEVVGLRTHHLGPLSFTVAAGECVALTGPSGAGKSLLLRAIVDLDPHDGTVSWRNETDQSVPAPEWRRRIGLMPADPRWWAPTVGDHFPEAADEASRAETTLSALGFDTDVLTWPVARLSSGESQRLALARLIAHNSEVLLLDEPTAHLDEASAKRVEHLIETRRREMSIAVLWVSHDRGQIERISTSTLTLADGRLEERPR